MSVRFPPPFSASSFASNSQGSAINKNEEEKEKEDPATTPTVSENMLNALAAVRARRDRCPDITPSRQEWEQIAHTHGVTYENLLNAVTAEQRELESRHTS